ncbi:hypothetical protein ABPG75_000888 [Micractinium tetrahymenae]
MDPAQPAPCSESLLPEPLLGAILGLAGIKQGLSVTLVCKRWHRAFWAEPSLWRRFLLRPGRAHAALPARVEVLRRVAPLVAELTVETEANILNIQNALHPSMEDVELLSGLPALQHLELFEQDCVSPEVEAALRQRAPHLTITFHYPLSCSSDGED